jgi:hypothetical protein
MGKDAVVSCLCRFLHPRQVIDTHFFNAEKNFCIENLRVCRREMKKIRGQDQMCLIVVSQDIRQDGEPVELHANESHFKILREGPSHDFFQKVTGGSHQGDPKEELELLPLEVRKILTQSRIPGDDAALSSLASSKLTMTMHQHQRTLLVEASKLRMYLKRSGGTQQFATGVQQQVLSTLSRQ